MTSAGEAAAVSPGRAADQKYCHSCGAVLHFSATQCPKCGATQSGLAWTPAILQPAVTGAAEIQVGSLAPGHVYCRGCGQGIHETALSCPKCGATQRAQTSGGTTGANRGTAAVLAILLGGLGAHKFYLGQIFLGLVYLLFFWTFIPAIVGFVEGIYYLTMSDAEFSRKF
jgi:RNA polymerase subunit RPABC4/transcription elongation factor Spt4